MATKTPHQHDHADPTSLLRQAGLKVTKPRLALLEIMTKEHGPFTTDELHARVAKPRAAGPVDLVTIYRCLAKFESLGLISRCDFGDGPVRYELRAKNHHHHHIICRVCKRIEPLPECPVEDKSIRLPKVGFREVSHRLEFFGVCPDCYKRSA
jgi:Fur family ferric uptake transcriptional regulator